MAGKLCSEEFPGVYRSILREITGKSGRPYLGNIVEKFPEMFYVIWKHSRNNLEIKRPYCGRSPVFPLNRCTQRFSKKKAIKGRMGCECYGIAVVLVCVAEETLDR